MAMTVSSRTPEGLPSHCSLCRAETCLEFFDPADDASCPKCGCLLWKSGQVLGFVRNSLSKTNSIPLREIDANSVFENLRNDSLDFIELLIELEDEFDVVVSDADDSEIRTAGDLVRYVINRQLKAPQ